MNHFIRLRDECNGVKRIKPVLDVPTRWNSTYQMISKALELRTPLTMIISTDNDLQPFLLGDEEWTYLTRMKTLLEVRQHNTVYPVSTVFIRITLPFFFRNSMKPPPLSQVKIILRSIL